MGRWGQEMLLGDQDYLDGVEAANLAEDIGFAAVDLMSINLGMLCSAVGPSRHHPPCG